MIGVRLGVGHQFAGGFDSSASAYFTATGITGATEQQAVNTLVTSLKSAGLWSKMKAVYPFVTDNRNLLSYTEDFGNAYWIKNNATVTANTAIAPNGTTTADTLSDNLVNNFHYINTGSSIGNNGNNTLSIYAKENTLNYLYLYFYNGVEAAGATAWFNLSSGTIGTVQSGLTASIENAGNGWYRCSITRNFNFSTNNSNCGFGVSNADNVGSYLGTNKSIFVWGAQLDAAATATTYQPIATTQQSYISNQFKYNLVNPVDSDAAFRGVFNGGWTFSYQGALPNGTNGYMDTKLVPSSALQLNSVSHSVYSRSLSPTGIMGGVNDAVAYLLLNNATSTTITSQLNTIGADFITGTITNSQGLLMANRTDSTTVNAWRNSTKVATDSKMSTFRPTIAYYIGSRNNGGTASGYDAKQYGFYHIGDGLTDTEATALYNAVQTFNQNLNRSV